MLGITTVRLKKMKPLSIIYLTINTISNVFSNVAPFWLKKLFSFLFKIYSNVSMFTWSSQIYICKSLRFLLLKIFAPLFLITGCTLICSAKLAFLIYYLPELSYNLHSLYILHLCLGLFFFINVMFNYIMCAFSSPGYPPKCIDLALKTYKAVDGKKVFSLPSRIDIAPGVSYRYCKYCECVKPPRAHHDRYVYRDICSLPSVVFHYLFYFIYFTLF
jgi:hypothetical protein